MIFGRLFGCRARPREHHATVITAPADADGLARSSTLWRSGDVLIRRRDLRRLRLRPGDRIAFDVRDGMARRVLVYRPEA
jgi:hypothetical protein